MSKSLFSTQLNAFLLSLWVLLVLVVGPVESSFAQLKPSPKVTAQQAKLVALELREKQLQQERLQLTKAKKRFETRQYRQAFTGLYRYRNSSVFDDRAILYLGRCYLLTIGNTPPNPNRAVAWLSRVSRSKSVGTEASFLLGELYLNGSKGLSMNVPKAVPYLQRAVNRGNLNATWLLGQVYLNGTGGVVINEPLGIQLLEKAANAGKTEAQWTLAVLFTQGTATLPKNLKMAKFWYQKIAVSHPVSLTNNL